MVYHRCCWTGRGSLNDTRLAVGTRNTCLIPVYCAILPVIFLLPPYFVASFFHLPKQTLLPAFYSPTMIYYTAGYIFRRTGRICGHFAVCHRFFIDPSLDCRYVHVWRRLLFSYRVFIPHNSILQCCRCIPQPRWLHAACGAHAFTVRAFVARAAKGQVPGFARVTVVLDTFPFAVGRMRRCALTRSTISATPPRTYAHHITAAALRAHHHRTRVHLV